MGGHMKNSGGSGKYRDRRSAILQVLRPHKFGPGSAKLGRVEPKFP